MRRKKTSGLDPRFLEMFLPYQREWLNDPRQFKIGLWARQTGKDYTCAAEAAFESITHPGQHWIIVACGERQATESLLKAKEWARRINQFLARRANRCRIKESANEIRFENGSRITALPAKPETVRGYSANIILTEFAFHDDMDAIWQAIYPSVSNPVRGGFKKLRIISTPGGHGNLFHRLWMGVGESAAYFSRHCVTIYQAHQAGLPINIDQLKAGMVEPEAWSQEYECQFVDQSSVLLPYALIEACEHDHANETTSDLSTLTGDLFVGIDFGRKQDLTVCWLLQRLGQEFWTREVLALRGLNTPAQADLLRSRVRLARRVCLDYTGAGIGLGDLLAEEFHTVNEGGKIDLCNFTQPLKEELFPKLRALLERRKVWLPRSASIREDLHSVHRVVSQNGKFSYRASHSADGHSDRCTALALALRASEGTPITAAASTVGRRYPFLARR